VQAQDRLDTLDPTRGLVRIVRGTGVGAAAVVVALAGHVAGQGQIPTPTILVATLAGAALVAWALSFSRWTLASLTGVLIAAQSVLHLSFAAGAGSAAHHQTGPMLLGHAAATVVMVALLYRGEQLLWAVVESLSLRVWRSLREVVSPTRAIPFVPVVDRRSAMPRSWLGSEPPRRGPPTRSSFQPVPA
jgi:hypothetical protein